MNLKPLTGALDTCFFPKMSELITIGKVATGPQIANCRTGHGATTWYMSLQLPCWASRPDGHLSNALNDCREFLERERATCSPAHSNVSKSQLLSQTELCPLFSAPLLYYIPAPSQDLVKTRKMEFIEMSTHLPSYSILIPLYSQKNHEGPRKVRCAERDSK